MKAHGTKRILPVYGNSRPLERRINNVKIAGWKEQLFNATSVSQNDTYNDSAFLKIYGKSEQIQTIQGKNLFDAYNYVTSYPDDIKPVNQDGEDWIKMQSSTKQARYNFNAKENTQYTFTFEFKRYDDSGSYSTNFALYYTDGTSETLDFGYYGDGILHKVSKTSAQNKTISYIRNANNGNTVYFLLRVNGSQIEEGITATSYEPFVPNSPSPDYPSTINSVSNFDLVSSDEGEQENIINFPYTLRNLPDGTKDYIEIDNVNKTAKLYKNIEIVTLNSGTEWTIAGAKNNSSIRGTHTSKTALSGTILTETIATSHTLIYELATPIITNLSYSEIKTYFPNTQIYTNAIIQPTLDGKIRIIDRGDN